MQKTSYSSYSPVVWFLKMGKLIPNFKTKQWQASLAPIEGVYIITLILKCTFCKVACILAKQLEGTLLALQKLQQRDTVSLILLYVQHTV